MRPEQSIVSSPSRLDALWATRSPIASIFPSTINTSAAPSIDCDGSITRPPRSNNGLVIGRLPLCDTDIAPTTAFCRLGVLRTSARQHVEHGHSNGHAVRHLV